MENLTKALQEIQKIASEALANVKESNSMKLGKEIGKKIAQDKSTKTSKDKEKLDNTKYFLLHNDITKARLDVNSKQEHSKGLFYFVVIESRRIKNIVFDRDFIRKETCITGNKSLLKQNRVLNIGVLKNIFRRNKSLLKNSKVQGYSLLSIKDYEKKSKELGKTPYYTISNDVYKTLENSLKDATRECLQTDRFIDIALSQQVINELAKLANICGRDELVEFIYTNKKLYLKAKNSMFDVRVVKQAVLKPSALKGKSISLHCFAGLSGNHTLRVSSAYAFINAGDSKNQSIIYFKVRKGK